MRHQSRFQQAVKWTLWLCHQRQALSSDEHRLRSDVRHHQRLSQSAPQEVGLRLLRQADAHRSVAPSWRELRHQSAIAFLHLILSQHLPNQEQVTVSNDCVCLYTVTCLFTLLLSPHIFTTYRMYMAAQILLPVRNLLISMTKGPETRRCSQSQFQVPVAML